MQDPNGMPRDPAYDQRTTVRTSSGNGIYFVLGAIVVALGVIFFVVSGNDSGSVTDQPATTSTTINNEAAPAANEPAATTPAPDAAAPAQTAPEAAPEATPAPSGDAAPADSGSSTTAPAN